MAVAVNLYYCKFENVSVSACCMIVVDYRHIESLNRWVLIVT